MAWTISNAMMKAYENSRSSLEPAAEFSEATCSDGEPSAPSNTTPMPDQYYWPDKTTEHYRLSRFGMTCEPLTESHGEALLTWFRGGFPCQDISAAGKGAGLEGERSGLWSEFARIISEVRPRRVLVENSPMLTSRGLGRVLGDLAAMGYDAKWGVISAADTGAPHRRERIWIVANSKLHWIQERWGASASEQETGEPRGILANEQSSSNQQERESMAYAMRQRQQGIIAGQLDTKEWKKSRKRPDRPRSYGFGRWPTEPGLGRVANGVANRADRIKAIGNGQVSRVVAAAWRILSDEN